MVRAGAVLSCVSLLVVAAVAQVKDGVKPFVKEDAPVMVLNHVRVIDGTGAAPMEDQRIDIENGKITRVQRREAAQCVSAECEGAGPDWQDGDAGAGGDA
jgi:hypothetical protein